MHTLPLQISLSWGRGGGSDRHPHKGGSGAEVGPGVNGALGPGQVMRQSEPGGLFKGRGKDFCHCTHPCRGRGMIGHVPPTSVCGVEVSCCCGLGSVCCYHCLGNSAMPCASCHQAGRGCSTVCVQQALGIMPVQGQWQQGTESSLQQQPDSSPHTDPGGTWPLGLPQGGHSNGTPHLCP